MTKNSFIEEVTLHLKQEVGEIFEKFIKGGMEIFL